MRINRVKFMTAGMLILTFMTGCGLNGYVMDMGADGTSSGDADGYYEESQDDVNSTQSGKQEDKDDADSAQSGEQENKDDADSEQAEGQKSQDDANSGQSEESKKREAWKTATAEELEEELARYRKEREENVKVMGNYEMVWSPNEANYKYLGDWVKCYVGSFDTRQLTLALKTAQIYVQETLHLEGEADGCIDPRMSAIFEDEDKGVANGYDANDLFLAEYEDHGTWKYLILVWEKKDSDWKVLYHGSSYKV